MYVAYENKWNTEHWAFPISFVAYFYGICSDIHGEHFFLLSVDAPIGVFPIAPSSSLGSTDFFSTFLISSCVPLYLLSNFIGVQTSYEEKNRYCSEICCKLKMANGNQDPEKMERKCKDVKEWEEKTSKTPKRNMNLSPDENFFLKNKRNKIAFSIWTEFFYIFFWHRIYSVNGIWQTKQ